MTAGEKIRKRRLELGIKQKDVARMIGTTSAYVSAVEKQKRGVNKETRLEKFAEALQCSVNDLKSDAPKGMVDPTNDNFGCYADGQFWDEIGERLPKDVTVTHWMAFPMV